MCLRGDGRAIILDTKFYAEALKAGSYGTPKLSSANLYQLFTCLRHVKLDDQHTFGVWRQLQAAVGSEVVKCLLGVRLVDYQLFLSLPRTAHLQKAE